MKRSNGYRKVMPFAALLALGFSAGTYAVDDLVRDTDIALSQDNDVTLNSVQIDIDGHFGERRKSPADQLEAYRKKLEKANEEMVDKKIEDMRMQSEKKLTKQLYNAMNGGRIDSVGTKAAAVKKIVKKKPVVLMKKNKVIPTFSATNFDGDGIDLDSNVTAGLTIETMITPRFSIGGGVNYTTVDMTDVANNYVTPYNGYYNNYYNNNYYPYYNNGYYNHYGQGREMSYKKMGIEVNGKFFILAAGKFRPYIGAGLGYNKHSLEYDNNNPYYSSSYNVQFGDEEFSSNFIDAKAMMGAEVNFTRRFGMVFEVEYSTAIGGGFDESYGSTWKNPDQVRLENVGVRIEESDVLSIGGGVLFRF